MNRVDYLVMLGTVLTIAVYGIWRTRGKRDLNTYLRGSGNTSWIVIGLSVMATQASATTFLSMPGQGFNDGLGFVQNYFGTPLALIIVAAFFLPIYRRLKVYTAYEYLGQRFDSKTRLLGAFLFLLQRGLGAGITIYAPAIVLCTVFGWRLDVTIICSGLVVILYTTLGGSDAVNLTQKYQLTVIFAGMLLAMIILILKLPSGLKISDALAIADGMHKLKAVDFNTDFHQRYTFWSGSIGGLFLALAYFGTDQSQVQRYISGASLRESRWGLMFNAVCKIPMQFFILLLGVLVFVFYQFETQPVYFNQAVWKQQSGGPQFELLEKSFAAAHAEERQQLLKWMDARHSGNTAGESAAFEASLAAQQREQAVRQSAKDAITASNKTAKANDNDYVFITFILDHLPHGVIGLLVAAFFAAAMSSKAAELNSLSSTTTIDVYRHLVKRDANDRHYLIASKCFIVMWGLVAIAFALLANLSENLIQAGNIVGSIFYGPMIGLFLTAFFVKKIRGTAVFWAVILSQILVVILYYKLTVSYLWFNLIGCAICMATALIIEALRFVQHEIRSDRSYPQR